ncbi:MAG: RecQ family zinc-binding domain-containing protein [Flavobacteriales bacterium]|nr:RecQ family zinc-binding domain-containing protein [Flavobacteriales bacterium]
MRTVIHLGFPDSLEAYFQEAGRAGRDGKESFAVALVGKSDILNLEKNLNQEFPDREQIKNTYHALGSLLQLAEGSGEDEFFDLDLASISKHYNWKPKAVLSAISFLEKADHLMLSTTSDTRSTAKFIVNKDVVYDLELRNPKVGRLTRVLLRSYARLFEEAVAINENLIAKRAGYSTDQAVVILKKLHAINVIEYRPSTGLPKIEFVGGRVRKQDIHIPKSIYEDRIKLIRERIAAALHFLKADKICRSQMLLKYFGETESKHCGKCDVCRGFLKQELSEAEIEEIKRGVASEISIDDLILKFENKEDKEVVKAVQLLLDNGELIYKMNGKLGLVG